MGGAQHCLQPGFLPARSEGRPRSAALAAPECMRRAVHRDPRRRAPPVSLRFSSRRWTSTDCPAVREVSCRRRACVRRGGPLGEGSADPRPDPHSPEAENLRPSPCPAQAPVYELQQSRGRRADLRPASLPQVRNPGVWGETAGERAGKNETRENAHRAATPAPSSPPGPCLPPSWKAQPSPGPAARRGPTGAFQGSSAPEATFQPTRSRLPGSSGRRPHRNAAAPSSKEVSGPRWQLGPGPALGVRRSRVWAQMPRTAARPEASGMSVPPYL